MKKSTKLKIGWGLLILAFLFIVSACNIAWGLSGALIGGGIVCGIYGLGFLISTCDV